MSSSTPTVTAQSTARTITVLTLVHAALISIVMLMFAWPALTAEPRDVPIGIVGPAPAVAQISDRIDAQQEGALDLIAFDAPAEAAAAIEERTIYGAIVLSESPEALVSSAASPAVAQLLNDLTRTIVESSATQAGILVVPVTVTDVVAFTDADPRGAVFASFALPLVIGGISLAAFAALRLTSLRARATLVGVASLTTGVTLTGIMTGWLGVLPGPFWLTALAVCSTLAGLAYSLVGAHALFGRAGFATLTALLFLLGNPLNGVALPPEFYIGAWGAVGQIMPVGAGFDLLRSITFFDAAPTGGPWTVLIVWLSCGLAALGLASFVQRSRPQRTA